MEDTKRKAAEKLSILDRILYPSLSRLTGEIRVCRERIAADLLHTNFERQSVAERCIDFLDQADAAIAVKDINGGWKCFNEACRRELFLLDNGGFTAKILALRNEAAQKLDNWRRTSVEEILDRAESEQDEAASRTLLASAMEVRDAHNDNLYFRKDLVRNHMIVLAICLAVLLAAFVAIFVIGQEGGAASEAAGTARDGATAHAPRIPWQLLVSCALLGGIGACLSALMSISSKETIPDQFTSIFVTGARPLIGAASGMVAVFFLKTELFNLGNGTSAVWVLAFALGFSERLIMGTMEMIGNKSK